jgi:hypothetical protein
VGKCIWMLDICYRSFDTMLPLVWSPSSHPGEASGSVWVNCFKSSWITNGRRGIRIVTQTLPEASSGSEPGDQTNGPNILSIPGVSLREQHWMRFSLSRDCDLRILLFIWPFWSERKISHILQDFGHGKYNDHYNRCDALSSANES